MTRIIGELQNSDSISAGKKSSIAGDIQKAANAYGTCDVLPAFYATALEHLVDAASASDSSRNMRTSCEDDEDLEERDYRDVAFELLEPLQKHAKKETARQLEELLAGHTGDAQATMRRFDAIIKRKSTHPAVVKLAIRRREELRRQILEQQIFAKTGSTSVEAALKAVPMQLKRAKESGDILQIEREMENAMEVASLAERRDIVVEPETRVMLKEVIAVQQKMEEGQRHGLVDLFKQFPPSTSDDKITRLLYEADIYLSLAASCPTGTHSRFFQSVNAKVFTHASPKQKKLASLEAKKRKQQAKAEKENRLQAQAQENLDGFLKDASKGRYVDPETSKAAAVVKLGEQLVPWLTAAVAEASKWGEEVGDRAKGIAKRKVAHVWIEVFLHRLQEATVSQSKERLLSVCDSITSHYTQERKKDRSQKMPARLLGPMNRGRRLVTQWTITPPVNRDAQEDKLRAKTLKVELTQALVAQNHDRLHAVIQAFENEQWLDLETVLQGTSTYKGKKVTTEELLNCARAGYAELHEVVVNERRQTSKARIQKQKEEAEGKQEFYDAEDFGDGQWDDEMAEAPRDEAMARAFGGGGPAGGDYYRNCCGDGAVDMGCAIS